MANLTSEAMLGQIEVLDRRARSLTAVANDSVSLRQVGDIQSTARQIASERERWLVAQEADRGSLSETLQFLIDTQRLLLDRAEERRRLVGLVEELARTWTLLAGQLLQQDTLSFAEFRPFLDAFPQFAARLSSPQGGRLWLSLLPALEASVEKCPRAPGMPEAGLVSSVLADGWGAGLQCLLAEPSGSAAKSGILCGLLFRDVGWLSLAAHRRLSQRMGPARQAWLFAQHPAVGAGLWDAVGYAPLVIREIAGGHHERLNGRGIRRWPAGRQSAVIKLAAAASRLIELVRLSEGVVETAVADLRAEAETGVWSLGAVEELLAKETVFPSVAIPSPRPDGTSFDLHDSHLLPAPHATESARTVGHAASVSASR